MTPFKLTEFFIRENKQERPKPISFCLTIRNMPYRDFHNAVVGMLRAFDRLAGLGLRFALGTYRHLEVTYNGNYHPHLHCLMIVPGAYFAPAARIYLNAPELSEMWAIALGVDYQTVTAISRVDDLASWFGYLRKPMPLHLADIQIAKFGGGLAKLERRLMSQKEDIAYGRGTDFRSQLARNQSDGQGGGHREQLVAQSTSMGSLDD